MMRWKVLLLILGSGSFLDAQEESTSYFAVRRATRVSKEHGATAKAVDLALRWLAVHQEADGRWDGRGLPPMIPKAIIVAGRGRGGTTSV